MPPPRQPQRQDDLPPSFGVSALQTLVNALAQRQQQRQELQDALQKIGFEQRLKEEAEERTPERILQRIGLARAAEAGRVPTPLGGFTPHEEALGLPEQVQGAATNRLAKVLEQFGLIKPTPPSFQQVFTVNPVTGDVQPVGSVPRGSKTVVTPQQPVFRQQLQLGLQRIGAVVGQLEQQFNTIQDVERGFGARVTGTGKRLSGFFGEAPEVQAFEGLRSAVLGTISKIVSEEGGRLTDQDIQRVQGAIPKLTDTREEARLKFQNLRSITEEVIQLALQREGKLFPQPSTTPSGQSFIEGKTYTDAQGNRAIYRNGRFDPVR